MSDRWKLYVMGCRGSWPICGPEFAEFGGATSCYILKKGSHALVVDCGTGLYTAGPLLADCTVIDVVLTHVHYDHLMGILNWSVFPRTAQLRFYARFSAWYGTETFARFMHPPFWPYTPRFHDMVDVEVPGTVELEDEVSVDFWPSTHPDGSSLLRVNTPDGDVCVAFDYEHTRPFPERMCRDCAVLLYDSMFTGDEYENHRGWGHSCWEMGCELARRTNVRHLVLTHHAPDKTDAELLEQERLAGQVLPGAHFARQQDVLVLDWKPETRVSMSAPMQRIAAAERL